VITIISALARSGAIRAPTTNDLGIIRLIGHWSQELMSYIWKNAVWLYFEHTESETIGGSPTLGMPKRDHDMSGEKYFYSIVWNQNHRKIEHYRQ